MYYRYLIAVGVLLCTCGRAPEDSEKEVPWAGVTFDQPRHTEVTIVNEADSSIHIRVHYLYQLKDFGVGVGDSLPAGDSLIMSLDLYQPDALAITTAYRRFFYDVLPGMDRTIVYGERENYDRGPHVRVYMALNLLEKWSPNTVGQELAGLLYPDFVDYQKEVGRAALDSLKIWRSQHPEQPSWLSELMETKLRSKTLRKMVSYASYRRFFYEEEHTPPEWLRDTVTALLASEKFGESFEYNDLFKAYTLVNSQLSPDSSLADASVSTRNHWALTNAYLDLPDDDAGHVARGTWLLSIIGKNRSFTDRQRMIDTLSGSLPEGYRVRMEQFAEALAQARGEEELLALLSTPFAEAAGDTLAMLDAQSSQLTLYKFWFTGCYPCLLTYPDERELLQRYPELEIHTIAFSTSPAEWRDYLENRRPPGSKHFHVPNADRKLIRQAMGSLGAPQFVLMKGEEPICMPCAKPGDEQLENLLAARLQ